MAPKRIPSPPSLSSDEDKDEQLIETPDSDDEVVEESSSDDEQQTPTPAKKPSVQEAQSESESEEEDLEEDEEQPTPLPVKKTIVQKPEESVSESDSDFESGKTESSPTASDFAIKPIASKPMVDSTKNKKQVKGKVASTTTVVVAKPSAKRAIEAERSGLKESKSKKVKVSNGDGVVNEEKEKEKKSAINRLWSDDDEITILQGIVDYRLKKGTDPNADMGAFLEFIKENLDVDVSKLQLPQLSDKIRRLKKKYLTNVEKGGEDPVFSKPHDCRSFELLKKIWGKGGVLEAGSINGAKSDNGQAKKSGAKVSIGNASLAKIKEEGKAIALKEKPKVKDEINDGKAIVVKEKAKGKDEIKVADGDFAEMYPYFNSVLDRQTEPFRALSEKSQRLVKEKLGKNKEAKELNEEFKKFAAQEFEMYVKKLELMKKTAGMIVGALKPEE